MKLAIIDNTARYTIHFGSAVSNQLQKNGLGTTLLYFPKTGVFGGLLRRRICLSNSNAFWSSFLYPFQICRKAKADKIEIAHIQLEINTFGHPITLALFPLLLIGLGASKINKVITLHGTFPRFLLLSSAPQTIVRNIFSRIFFLGFFTLFYKITKCFSSRLIVHSSIFKDWLTDYGINAEKIVVIPHGIVANPINCDETQLAYWAKKTAGKRVILCFGVLSPRKGLENLIRAFELVYKEHPDTILILSGDEPVYFSGYKEKLRSLSKELNIDKNVLFAGHIPEKDIGPLFEVAKVVVLPYSYSISASGPLSIALQYSKPIVATDTVFFRSELTNNENCLLSKSGSFISLSNNINTILASETLRNQLSNGARALALKNSWEKVASMTIDLYQKLQCKKSVCYS